jgi:uracil phosphoribosyltransferase
MAVESTPSTVGTRNLTEVRHPLVQHKLGLLRDVTTTTQMFRQLVNELTLLLTYEATKGLADEQVEIETPLERMTATRISGKKVAICPILRAGVGMLDAVLSLLPGARVGFIGLYRNEETLEPVEYFVKLPNDIADRDVILLDPMLATGNSTAAAVETLKRAGATSVRLIALIAAPEGIERIHRDHPDVSIVLVRPDTVQYRGSLRPSPACISRPGHARSQPLEALRLPPCSRTCDRAPRSSGARSSHSGSSCCSRLRSAGWPACSGSSTGRAGDG